jgi:serine/threonine-protein kinase
MSLQTGKRLGSFEITSLIGSGGMGEVYRAKDLKLGREVAIKALPDLFSKDKERLSRFDREARLLASLNHPNIATIYGLEEADGEHYLVLELVEGETLAERIKRGSLPLEETLPLFMQIAEALETAHEKGIIHRDLKPANIKVTPDGKVKVLDFGLAKALSGEIPADSGLSESPTITKDATGTGVLLGTAPYMSPEQARGKDVDKRTDIWAFGCCLYEALTGKVAFLGETVSDTIARILKEDPDWSLLPPKTPSSIRSLLRRCLRKDAQKRLHDIADARIEIEESLAEPMEKAAIVETRPSASRLKSIAALFMAVIAGGLVVYLASRPGPAPPHQPERLNIYLPLSLRMAGWGIGGALAISPDGKLVVFAGVSEGWSGLYMRSMDQLDVTPIPGTRSGLNPFFSPDGQWLGFATRSDRKLKKVSVRGGAPITICDADRVRGASWGEDGTIVFNAGGQGLTRVSDEGGMPEVLTRLEGQEYSHRWPQILPGGRAVLFSTVTKSQRDEERTIEVVSLETGDKKVLMEGATYARYVSTGHLLFARAGTVFAAPFDLERLDTTGDSVPVLEDVYMQSHAMGFAYFASSNNGSLIYVPGYIRPVNRHLVWVDREGNIERLPETPRPYDSLALSPDGKQLAINFNDPSYQEDVWIYDFERRNWTRLTFTGRCWSPIWTPDGQRVAFKNGQDAFWAPADGSSPGEPLLKHEIVSNIGHIYSWSPDGTIMTFAVQSRPSDWDLWRLHLEETATAQPFIETSFSELQGVFSPNGRWIAYRSTESGRSEVYVAPFPGPGPKRLISTESGIEPLWSRDGQELYYRSRAKLMVVSVQTEPSFQAGTPRVLFEVPQMNRSGLWRTYDVTPDGQRFIMSQNPEGTQEPLQIVYIPDWFEELKQLVPKNN